MTQRISQLAAAALMALACVSAQASSEYPSRQVTMVVGYPAGGAVDAVGRMLAQKLGDALGKPVVVDNKGGASGNIGAQFVAKSQPDGLTLLMAPITSYAMNGLLFPATTGYQLNKDFAGVSLVGYLPLVLVVNEAVPATNVKQLIQQAKAKPAGLNFGSSGNGSIEHVAGEMLKKQAGISMLHIPYRGASPAMTDLMAGQVQVMLSTVPTTVANVKTNKIRPLAVATKERIAALPDVPTAAEAGLPGFEVASTYAVLAPAATPKPILQRLNQELSKIAMQPEIKSRFLVLGVEPMSSTQDEATQALTQELQKWDKAIKDNNIKVD